MAIKRVDLGVGDSLVLDDGRIVVTLEHKSGQRAKLAVHADESVKISERRPSRAHEHARKGVVQV